MLKHFFRQENGATLIQVLATLMLVGIASQIVSSNIKELQNPLADASFEVSHFLKLVRARAISQTLAIEVRPSSSTQLSCTSRSSCSATESSPAPVSDLTLDLPNGAHFSDTDWSICFTQRGLSDAHITFGLESERGNSRTVEVALGGGVRIQ